MTTTAKPKPPPFPEDVSLRPGGNGDSARYLVDVATLERPWLWVPGSNIGFIWPIGVEEFDIRGTALVATHRAIGGNVTDAFVVNTDEMRVTLSGTFLGDKAPALGKALRQVCIAKTPIRRVGNNLQYGKLLYVPFALDFEQLVVVEDHNIRRTQEGEGIDYSVTMLKVGTGPRHTAALPTRNPRPPANRKTTARGIGTRRFRVNNKYNTLRKISKHFFATYGRWDDIYNVNRKWFEKRNIPKHRAPDYRIPIGTEIRF